MGDDTFNAQIAWYLAVAEERAGNRAGARAELDGLCTGHIVVRRTRVRRGEQNQGLIGMAGHRSVRTLIATILVCALALAPGARIRAQTPAPTPRPISAVMADALKAYADQRWDAAAEGFQTVVDLGRASQDEVWTARGQLGLARVAQRKANYDQSRALVAEALATFERRGAHEEQGMAEETLGVLAELTGDGRTSASTHYERAAAAFDAAGDKKSRLNSTYNVLRTNADDLPVLVPRLRALVDDADAVQDWNTKGAALHLWGDRLFVTGDYDAAIEKLYEAADVLETHHGETELGTVYVSLGRIFRLHGQFAAALRYQLKGVELNQKLGRSFELVQSYNATAIAYQSLGDVRHAKEYFEKAIALADTTLSPVTRNFLRANYGGFLISNGDPATGIAMVEATLSTVADPQQTVRYQQLSAGRFRLKQFPEALADAGRAVAACDKALTKFDCIGARLLKAHIELAAGDEAAALADRDEALNDLEATHAQLAAEDFLKQGFEDLWTPFYSVSIELHFRRGEISEALDTAERGRSRAFVDLLASRDIHASQPAATVTLTTRGAGTATIRSEGVAAHATTEQLRAMAAKLHSTVVLYWVGDDKVFEWVMRADGALSSASVSVPRRRIEELVQATSAFTDAAGTRGESMKTRGAGQIPLVMRPRPEWRELYDLPILPIAQYLPTTPGARLTIVPHGPLMNVPFAALKDAQGRYLIERYALHSLTAGAMLEYTRARTGVRTGPMLLVADPAQTPRISRRSAAAPAAGRKRRDPGDRAAAPGLEDHSPVRHERDRAARPRRDRPSNGHPFRDTRDRARCRSALILPGTWAASRRIDQRATHRPEDLRAEARRRSRRAERVPIGRRRPER